MFLDDDLLRQLAPHRQVEATKLPGGRPMRIAIYSHDAQGLGHLRRNLLVSRSVIAEDFRPSVLMISGLRETAAYEMPEGVDSLTLPALGKAADGSYYARSLRMDARELVRIRSTLIRGAVESYRPDVLIVDKLPLGIFGELRSALAWLRERGRARIVLGLRDILDEPAIVQHEWARDNCNEAIRAFYDRLWVYGDRDVYDAAKEYSLPSDIAAKMRYTGYLNPREARAASGSGRSQIGPGLSEIMDLPTGSLTLCVIGGGRDGLPLAQEFLRAPLPTGTGGVLVTGPLMEGEDRAMLHTLAGRREDIRLVEFVTDPKPLLCCADRVISMGGYNSVCEALAFQKRTLIVPRVSPRREQLIRAERFAALGLLDMLHPENLTADTLSRWMHDDARPVPSAAEKIDFGGVGRLPHLLQEALCDVVTLNGKAVAHA